MAGLVGLSVPLPITLNSYNPDGPSSVFSQFTLFDRPIHKLKKFNQTIINMQNTPEDISNAASGHKANLSNPSTFSYLTSPTANLVLPLLLDWRLTLLCTRHLGGLQGALAQSPRKHARPAILWQGGAERQQELVLSSISSLTRVE